MINPKEGSIILTEMERKVIEESVLKRLKERYPGAKGGRILSKMEGFMGHVHEGKVKIVYTPGLYKRFFRNECG